MWNLTNPQISWTPNLATGTRNGYAQTVALSLWFPSLSASQMTKVLKPLKLGMSYCRAASFTVTNPNTGSLALSVTGSENDYPVIASARFPDLTLSKTGASSTSTTENSTAQIQTVKENHDGDRQQ